LVRRTAGKATAIAMANERCTAPRASEKAHQPLPAATAPPQPWHKHRAAACGDPTSGIQS
ncbi:hypothetical protein N4G40_03695, partial [Pantoea eucrina]